MAEKNWRVFIMNSKRKKLIENFYNEIGNEISISVEKTNDVNKKKSLML